MRFSYSCRKLSSSCTSSNVSYLGIKIYTENIQINMIFWVFFFANIPIIEKIAIQVYVKQYNYSKSIVEPFLCMGIKFEPNHQMKPNKVSSLVHLYSVFILWIGTSTFKFKIYFKTRFQPTKKMSSKAVIYKHVPYDLENYLALS